MLSYGKDFYKNKHRTLNKLEGEMKKDKIDYEKDVKMILKRSLSSNGIETMDKNFGKVFPLFV